MGWLFVAALIFAIPTYGLSIIAWFALMFIKANHKNKKIEQRRTIADAVIHPLFKNNFAEFYRTLEVPYVSFTHNASIPEEYAESCGRHIANYISHNNEETKLFIAGLKIWTLKGSYELCSPEEAAECERTVGELGYVHLVSWRAIEALIKNNNLLCFDGVNETQLTEMINQMEIKIKN